MFLNQYEHLDNISPKSMFYRAVVENNNDGGQHGKVQVRIFGIHPQNAMRTGKNIGVLQSDLPWAEVIVPVSGIGGMSGKGISAVILNGSWVWVFLDGGDWNKPIVVGIISGTSSQISPGPNLPSSGFNDPNIVYPIKPRLSEPDQNRLACNRKVNETKIITIRDASRDKAIPTATGSTWDEYIQLTTSASYPNNTVFETVGESYIEYDSSPGNERLHFFHNTGTYWEAQPKGDFQFKTKRDHFGVVDRDNKTLVKRDQMTTVQRNRETKIDKNETILVGKDHKETIKGTVTQLYKKTKDTIIDLDETILVKKTHSETVIGAVTQTYKATKTEHVTGPVTETLDATRTVKITGPVTETLSATKTVNVTGPVSETYSAGQTTSGGPMIKMSAGVILLN